MATHIYKANTHNAHLISVVLDLLFYCCLCLNVSATIVMEMNEPVRTCHRQLKVKIGEKKKRKKEKKRDGNYVDLCHHFR